MRTGAVIVSNAEASRMPGHIEFIGEPLRRSLPCTAYHHRVSEQAAAASERQGLRALRILLGVVTATAVIGATFQILTRRATSRIRHVGARSTAPAFERAVITTDD